MPVQVSYPGVYIEEIPSGVRTITGVATSVTAFIGRAKRGPVNKAVTINSFGDFERYFGGLDLQSTMSYAVRDFYLNGGSQAIIVRLYSPSTAEAVKARSAAQAVVKAAKTAIGTATTLDEATVTAVTKAATTEAEKHHNDPEAAAAHSILEAVTANAIKDAKVETVNQAIDEKLAEVGPITIAHLTVNGHSADDTKRLDAARAVAEAAKKAMLKAPTLDDPTAKAVNDAAKNVAAKYPNDPEKTAVTSILKAVTDNAKKDATVETVKQAIDEAVSVLEQAASAASSIAVNALQLVAMSEGAWGNSLIARIEHVEAPSAAGIRERFRMPANTPLFDLLVRDTATGSAELHRNLTYADTSRQVKRVLENESQLVRADGDTPTTGRPDKHANPDPGKAWSAEHHPPTYSEVATDTGTAQDSKPLDPKDYIGSDDDSKPRTGIHALDNVDLFNLLCIPPDTRASTTKKAVYQPAMEYCQKKRAMLIVDSPYEWGVNKDTAANTAKNSFMSDPILSGPGARNAALFFPRIVQPDPMREGQPDEFVPCGTVAGIMARTDVARGVWKAPAGIDAALNGVQALTVNLNDAENGMLNPLGINCLRSFPVFGKVIWGARTLRGADQLADEYKYIPVRRTALYIEESLYRGLKWVVFEPNDEPLWAQIRLNVGAFMHNLFRQGAFQGTTPRDAYFVKCDKETTTQNDINLGIVNIVVGFAPLKPAEFVIIKLQQMTGQIEV